MHVDRENLIFWYLLIQRSDLGIGHTLATIRISRLFLWYAMDDLMHVMQLWFLGIWNGHFSHLPRLNYGCKIECLQQGDPLSPYLFILYMEVLRAFILGSTKLNFGTLLNLPKEGLLSRIFFRGWYGVLCQNRLEKFPCSSWYSWFLLWYLWSES